jgi:hypothetical protein
MKVLILSALVLFLHAPVSAQTEQFPTVGLAMEAIGGRLSVRIGSETESPQPATPIRLDMSMDAATVLNSLISQAPAYKWTMDNSVYWLRPKVDSLSEISIANFSVNDATRAETSGALSSLPEVRNWLAYHHETKRNLITQSTYRDQTRKSLNLSGVSLGALLNQLIITFGDKQWSINHQTEPDNNKYVSIYF